MKACSVRTHQPPHPLAICVGAQPTGEPLAPSSRSYLVHARVDEVEAGVSPRPHRGGGHHLMPMPLLEEPQESLSHLRGGEGSGIASAAGATAPCGRQPQDRPRRTLDGRRHLSYGRAPGRRGFKIAEEVALAAQDGGIEKAAARETVRSPPPELTAMRAKILSASLTLSQLLTLFIRIGFFFF